MRRFPITLDTREARREVEEGAGKEVASQTEWALDPSKVYRAVVEREGGRVARGAAREVARKAPTGRSVGVPWLEDSFMAEELLGTTDPSQEAARSAAPVKEAEPVTTSPPPPSRVRGEVVPVVESGVAAILPATLAGPARAEPTGLATVGREASTMAEVEAEALVAGLEEIVMGAGKESTKFVEEGGVMSTKEEEADILAREDQADVEAREWKATLTKEAAIVVEEETVSPDNEELVMGILAESSNSPPTDILPDVDIDWLDVNSNVQGAGVGACRGEVPGVGEGGGTGVGEVGAVEMEYRNMCEVSAVAGRRELAGEGSFDQQQLEDCAVRQGRAKAGEGEESIEGIAEYLKEFSEEVGSAHVSSNVKEEIEKKPRTKPRMVPKVASGAGRYISVVAPSTTLALATDRITVSRPAPRLLMAARRAPPRPVSETVVISSDSEEEDEGAEGEVAVQLAAVYQVVAEHTAARHFRRGGAGPASRYFRLTRAPVDLGAVGARVAAGAYSSPAVLRADLAAMAQACREVLPRKDPLCRAAAALLAIADRQIAARGLWG